MENKNTIKGSANVTTKYYVTIQYPTNWIEERRDPYWVLVRTKDEAILCAWENCDQIIKHCWAHGINHEDVSFI